MEEFSAIKEICVRISETAMSVAAYEKSIEDLQNHNEKEVAEELIGIQSNVVEQLQRLTLALTAIVYPQKLELEMDEEKNREDEAEDGSVFMSGELNHKKTPEFEMNYPEETKKDE